jgi:hypothetical protein
MQCAIPRFYLRSVQLFALEKLAISDTLARRWSSNLRPEADKRATHIRASGPREHRRRSVEMRVSWSENSFGGGNIYDWAHAARSR